MHQMASIPRYRTNQSIRIGDVIDHPSDLNGGQNIILRGEVVSIDGGITDVLDNGWLVNKRVMNMYLTLVERNPEVLYPDTDTPVHEFDRVRFTHEGVEMEGVLTRLSYILEIVADSTILGKNLDEVEFIARGAKDGDMYILPPGMPRTEEEIMDNDEDNDHPPPDMRFLTHDEAVEQFAPNDRISKDDVMAERAQYLARPPVRTDTCSICLTKYADTGGDIVRLPCGHVFHFECMATWLASNQGDAGKCPLCRVPFTQKELVRAPPAKDDGSGHWSYKTSGRLKF